MRTDRRFLAAVAWIRDRIPTQYREAGYNLLPSDEDLEKIGLKSSVASLRDLRDRVVPESVASLLALWWATYIVHLKHLHFLVPSFLQAQRGPPKRLHPSAWLDGLRGTAAFIVVWHHASLLWFGWHIHNGFGSTIEDRLVIQWPFVRLLVAGLPHVMVFFVVSGYAISYKPLKLARQGRWADFSDALSSTAFRRHPRLFIPALVVGFVTAVMTYWGCFGTEGWSPDVAIGSRIPPLGRSFAGQIADWSGHALHLIDPVSRDMYRAKENAYDPNLWTLPVEFDCSMVIFVTIAAFSRLRPTVRLLLTFGLMIFCQHYTYWRIFLFASGMFLCDLKFHLDERYPSKPSPLLPEQADPESPSTLADPLDATPVWTLQRYPMFRKALWTTSFIMSIYILSIPEMGRGLMQTPGYITLGSLIPSIYSAQPDQFWLPLAAVWLLFTIDRAPHLQAIFTRPFPQYLGRISYSLYLIHGPLLWSLGRSAVATTVGWTGSDTGELYCFGIFLSACIFWPVAICLADLTTRGVDVKAVEFGRWVYDSLSTKVVAREERL